MLTDAKWNDSLLSGTVAGWMGIEAELPGRMCALEETTILLIRRFEVAANRIFDAAEGIQHELDKAEDRDIEVLEGKMRVGRAKRREWRRQDRIRVYLDELETAVVESSKIVYGIHYEQPVGSWQRRMRLRRLLSIAEHFERWADHTERLHLELRR